MSCKGFVLQTYANRGVPKRFVGSRASIGVSLTRHLRGVLELCASRLAAAECKLRRRAITCAACPSLRPSPWRVATDPVEEEIHECPHFTGKDVGLRVH